MLVNDPNRAVVQEYFQSLIESDPRLKGIDKDLGIMSLASEAGFSIDSALREITSKITETYDPKSEASLLARLMYELGYLRFQKPLVISAMIKNDDDAMLEEGQRFTDGEFVYLLDDAVSLKAGVPQKATATLGMKREIESDVAVNQMYHKIDLDSTYRELYRVEVYRGDTLLKYSQAFIEEDSDVSLEVDYHGNMSVVVRLNNTHGSNVVVGEHIKVVVYETEAINDLPDNLAMIGDFDSVCEDIAIHRNYEPYLSVVDMANIIKYNKNINNTLVYNEDYKRHILANIRGIKYIKVWQQENEDRENGALACNINRVFVSFIQDDITRDIGLEIQDLIAKNVYGKYTVIRAPEIKPMTINIEIVNNTKKSIALAKQELLKEKLIGYYDDVDRKFSKSVIYKHTVQHLDEYDIDISVTTSEKGEGRNARFFTVAKDDINITVAERDYL